MRDVRSFTEFAVCDYALVCWRTRRFVWAARMRMMVEKRLDKGLCFRRHLGCDVPLPLSA
jgi:hypothetical protein